MKEVETVCGKNVLPAEWSEQDGVQLTWPHAGTDWSPYLDEITEVCVKLVLTIAQREKVIIAAQDPTAVRDLLKARMTAGELAKVSVWPCQNDDTWARDHAFITLMPTASMSEEAMPLLLDFRFNGWGEKFPADKDNAINRQLYGMGVFRGSRVDCDDFVLEGGSIESDGCGTVFTTSLCLLAPNRNQPFGRAEIEQQLKDRLAANRVVWLDHGSLLGDDTDGHIDTAVRVAPNDTLVYVGCDDANDPQYDDFKALERQLQGLRTMQGSPYRLLRLPMPDAIYYDGERLPATYANFLVINGAVIMPTYAQPEKDCEALRVASQAFPDRKVVGLDARVVIRQHGSLHCMTMQFPKGALQFQ